VSELVVTALPLAALWIAAWFAFTLGHAWISLLIAVPAAGFLVRLFMIQHDCGHGSFFSHRHANDWVGRVIGVLTLTPYDFWRRTHAIHHATTGNLDHRGIGDVDTLTVREYRALSQWARLKYRLYRHPLIMFGLGPAYLFLLQYSGLVRRHQGISSGASSDHANGRRSRRVVVLNATPVRTYDMGARPRMAPARRRFAWQFAL
jgi:omega-6 fatty acid desaturase (delta-12 desaturase)